jgi:benzoate/toluate 1,2-dioxygenase alpha subunit
MADSWNDNALGLDGSRVIDRRVYVDPKIFDAEKQRIFAKTWQWVAHESELSQTGDYITVYIAGRNVVVVRDKQMTLNAFYNTCTHRGACLTERSRGNCGDSFVCMYHGWNFDMRGKFIGASWPRAYGPDFQKKTYDIPPIRLEVFGGNIFVCLDSDTVALEEFLGETAESIERFTGKHEVLGRVRWVYHGNWKLWHENFRDNYHPEFTHQLVGTGYRGVKVKGKNYELAPAHGLLAFPMQRDFAKIEAAMNETGGLDIDVSRSAIWKRPPCEIDPSSGIEIMAVFPNLDFQITAGGAIHAILQIVRPVSVDKTIVEALSFGVKGESPELRQWRLERSLDTQTSAGKVSGDDVEAAYRCTVGYSAVDAVRWSNIDRGQGPGTEGEKNDEYSLRAFYVAYKGYMGDALASVV